MNMQFNITRPAHTESRRASLNKRFKTWRWRVVVDLVSIRGGVSERSIQGRRASLTLATPNTKTEENINLLLQYL
jgi:hypothetical protein